MKCGALAVEEGWVFSGTLQYGYNCLRGELALLRPNNMYFLFCFNILLLCVTFSYGDEFIEKWSNSEWNCADENCSVPISIANAKQNYKANHVLKISFKEKELINILGKPIDSKINEWIVSVDGHRGLAPKNMLREQKVLILSPNLTPAKFDFSKLETIESTEKTSTPKPIKTHNEDISDDEATVEDEDINSENFDSQDKIDLKENIPFNVLETLKFGKNVESSSESNNGSEPNDSPPSNELSVSENNFSEKENSSLSGNLEPHEVEKNNRGEEKTNFFTNSGDPSSFKGSTVQNNEDSSLVSQNETRSTSINDASLQNNNHTENIKTNFTDVEGSQESPPPNASFKPDEESGGKYTNSHNSTETSQIPLNGSTLDEPGTSSPKVPAPLGGTESNESIHDIDSNKSAQESLSENKSTISSDRSDGDTNNFGKEKKEMGQMPLYSEPTQIPNLEKPETQENFSPKVSVDKSILYQYNQASIMSSNETSTERYTEAPTVNSAGTPTVSSAGTPTESYTEAPTASSAGTPTASYTEAPTVYSAGTPIVNSAGTATVNSAGTPTASYTEAPTMNSAGTPAVNSAGTPTESYTEAPTASYSEAPTVNSAGTPTASYTEAPTVNSAGTPTVNSAGTPTMNSAGTPAVNSDEALTVSSAGTPAVSSAEDPTISSTEDSTMNSTSDVGVTPEHEKSSTTSESIEFSESPPAPINNEFSRVEGESMDKESNVPDDIKQQSKNYAESNDLPKDDALENLSEVLEESTTNWFSPVSSIMNSFSEMFAKSDIGVDDTKTVKEFTNEKIISYEKDSSQGDLKNVCEKDNYCNQAQEIQKEEDSQYNDFITQSIPGLKDNNVSPSTLVCLIVTSIAILLFSLGYYYLENLKQDAQLAARINSLSAELFFAQKELTTAEENLTKANDDLQRLVSNSSSNEEELIKLKQELEENEDVKQKLEQEIKRLEKEIESLVESSNEMHRMLSESISEDERIQALLANIDDLKGVVSSKLEEISSLTNQLDNEKQEVELLTIALKKSEEKKESLEEKLEKVVHEVESKALSATKEFEEKIISLEKIIEEHTLERVNFEKEIYDLKQKCETLSVEKELAEKSLKKAQGLGPGKALADWLETKEVRVELIASQKEVEKLKTELEEAKLNITTLQGREKELLSEIETLNLNYETAEKNKIEALTKLQVLSNYFKEKETQLQEELGEKEALWLQKQSEDHTIYEQMRSLREENLSYKAQNEALKREILDQESSFKSQIANEEQKAQENWLQLRHTERRLKEAQMEAAHLRSRLTALETNSDSIDDKHNKSLDMVNGDGMGAASPPFMLYPPPDFIPPPPLISPSRPPPLGRLSSPPLTPPPPLSPYDIFPPPTASPPPPLRVHKPQPREPPQKQKDSQSSTHSSESTEKPVRRGKR